MPYRFLLYSGVCILPGFPYIKLPAPNIPAQACFSSTPFPGTDLNKIRQCKCRVLEAIYNRIFAYLPFFSVLKMPEHAPCGTCVQVRCILTCI